MCLKLRDTSLLFILYCNRKLCANGNSSFLSLSETFRSMKTLFWPFWNVQKREKLHFGLSETFRSIKIFFLVFLKCSEVWKTSFWPFWNVQKHEKLHFGLSEMFRSVKNFILVFLKCSEAWFFLFSPFRATLKHQKSLFRLSAPRLNTKKIPFRPYVVVRSTNFLFFMLMSLSEAIIFSISCLCRWQKRWKNSFLPYWMVL